MTEIPTMPLTMVKRDEEYVPSTVLVTTPMVLKSRAERDMAP